MNRGPWPEKAMEIAMPYANARGFVILCKRYHGCVCDFIIAEPGQTTIGKATRTKRLFDTTAGMAAQFPSAIAHLSRVPPDPGRSCEIWACDYYGNIRFFRSAGTGFVEINQHGAVIDPLVVPGYSGEVRSPGITGGEPGRHPPGGGDINGGAGERLSTVSG
ncbi:MULTISPECIES: hypothetical protein [unclassified Methanoregula]|uniref:hypothetical protein n=1 Tax=unclassified Methanoregula TaxID=2649730 RepID=UPI0009C81455|nr:MULTISPECIES: hypothetical protein [unclassified Methanoregula]OPX65167.1 MAG: hypothetical protein A4E33_00198 [Methanoregula sp. PtaB.Bin085]OPY32079.1 MAG: hypothetical protein A4E34_02451 [Methanoregula sp. PtaU1.Bin006]